MFALGLVVAATHAFGLLHDPRDVGEGFRDVGIQGDGGAFGGPFAFETCSQVGKPKALSAAAVRFATPTVINSN